MGKCAYCGALLLVVKIRRNGATYCNEKCFQKAAVLPEYEGAIYERAAVVHAGSCPRCGGPGPVDVRTSYRLYSIIFFTRWSARRRVSCAKCGRKQKLADLLFCFAFGWWGVPHGLLITPIWVARNAIALFADPDPARPSAALVRAVQESVLAGAVAQEGPDGQRPRAGRPRPV